MKHAILVLLFTCHCAFSAEPLRFVSDTFPPYQYLDDNGKPAGICVELLKQVYQQLGQPIEIEFLPWQRSRRMFAQGQYAGQLCVGKSPERLKLGVFADQYMVLSDWYAYKNRDNLEAPKVNQLEDFDNYSIGVTAGYTYSEKIWQYFNRHNKRYTLSNDVHGLKMLNYARFDYMLADKLSVNFLLSELPADQANISQASTKPLLSLPFYVLFNPKLVTKPQIEQFSQQLKAINASAQYLQIVNKSRHNKHTNNFVQY